MFCYEEYVSSADQLFHWMSRSNNIRFYYRRYSSCAHHLSKHGRYGRRVPDGWPAIEDAVGDSQGRPPSLVLLIPDFDFGAMIDQELGNRRDLLVRCAVDDRFSVLVNTVHVSAEIQSYFHSLKHFRFRPGIFSWRICADARGRHNRRRAVNIR